MSLINKEISDFTVQAYQNGGFHTVSKADALGHWSLFFFYPADFTFVCPTELEELAENYDAFKELGVEVIGVSKDSAASHEKFAAKYELPFILLSDPELTVLQAYDVWKEKKQYGKVSMGVVRSTYVIGPDGTIEKAMPKVKPDTNAADVLTALDALTANA